MRQFGSTIVCHQVSSSVKETITSSYPFLDDSGAIGLKKFFQVFDLDHKFPALVSVLDQHALAAQFHKLCGRLDVLSLLDRLLGR